MPESCLLCSSTHTRIHYRLRGWNIARCETCGFEYHDGFRGGGDATEMFSEEYYRDRQAPAFERQLQDYRNDPSAPVYARWAAHLAEHAGTGRLLDVGCALGTFLKIAEERGFAVEGVEISHWAADFARTHRGLSVFTGDLAAFPAPDGAFDVVTFWDSIEHVGDPIGNLRQARRLLRTGGLVLLTTDNFDCFVADLARVMYHGSGGLLRYGMERVFIEPNRSYFTSATMREALRVSGFEIQHLEKMEYPIDKIRTTTLERLLLRSVYATAAVLGREAQITVVARAV